MLQPSLLSSLLRVIYHRLISQDRWVRLVKLFNVIARNGSSLWLVYPEERQNSRKICVFRDWLLGEVQRSITAGLSSAS